MSQTEDQLNSVGGITDMVFRANHQERQFWRFCNSRLPRSEVVYFTQIIKIFLITVSLAKLVFFSLDCEESTFWFSLRSSKSKVMHKIISTSELLFMAVCGPSCCGKLSSSFSGIRSDDRQTKCCSSGFQMFLFCFLMLICFWSARNSNKLFFFSFFVSLCSLQPNWQDVVPANCSSWHHSFFC